MTKPRLLLCTIMRNQCANVGDWYHCLSGLSERLADDYALELSVVENDSTDGTAAWLSERLENWLGAPRPFLIADKWWLTTDKLGTTQYGSVWNLDRLRNLTAARQKCLDQAGDLSRFQKVAYIEPDVTYDPVWLKELILARHPAQAGIEPHIYSGWSLRTASHPKESIFLYDCTATRQTANDITWDFTEKGGEWRGESLVKTDLGGVDSNCLHRVWSTFNCFCVYDARPFQQGVRWDYINQRLNTGQLFVGNSVADDGGWLDSDTSVMCEAFRARGCSNILLNTNCLVRHA